MRTEEQEPEEDEEYELALEYVIEMLEADLAAPYEGADT